MSVAVHVAVCDACGVARTVVHTGWREEMGGGVLETPRCSACGRAWSGYSRSERVDLGFCMAVWRDEEV